MKFTTLSLMLTWFIFKTVCNSLGKNGSCLETAENTWCSWGNLLRDFSRETLCENAKYVSEQWSSRIPVMATFQKNPAARKQKMSPSSACPGPLSSPLFKRILRREWSCKNAKTDILTFAENPQARTTTKKTQFGRPGDNQPTWSTWLNSNYV